MLAELRVLDNTPVTPDERNEMMTNESLVDLEWIRKKTEAKSLGKSGSTMTQWAESVEQLDLNCLHIRRVCSLQQLINLRRASFSDNEMEKIEGIETCTLLEELCLDQNHIRKIEGLGSLVFLKKLDLGHNSIRSIDGLETLVHLTQLSLEDNQITSLRGLESLKSLMELYICNNNIIAIKEVQHLKDLAKLIILDLSGNGLCKEKDYRLYSIYYMRRLKVLDGVGVDAAEQADAHKKYSGKLTQEFLLEKIGHKYFEHIRELDLSSCRIRRSRN